MRTQLKSDIFGIAPEQSTIEVTGDVWHKGAYRADCFVMVIPNEDYLTEQRQTVSLAVPEAKRLALILNNWLAELEAEPDTDDAPDLFEGTDGVPYLWTSREMANEAREALAKLSISATPEKIERNAWAMREANSSRLLAQAATIDDVTFNSASIALYIREN